MMKLSIILLLFSNTIFSQYTDAKNNGLKGKVSSITEYNYNVKVQKDKYATDKIVKDTNAVMGEEAHEYNIIGNIEDSYLNLSWDESNQDMKYTYEYDNDRITHYSKKRKEKNQDVETANYHWINPFSYAFETYNLQDSLNYQQDTFLFNSKYQDSVKLFHIYNNDLLVKVIKIMYLYDVEGNLVMENTNYFNYEKDGSIKQKLIESIRYKYLKFDEQGNWLEREVIDGDTHKTIGFSSRTYEYYNIN